MNKEKKETLVEVTVRALIKLPADCIEEYGKNGRANLTGDLEDAFFFIGLNNDDKIITSESELGLVDYLDIDDICDDIRVLKPNEKEKKSARPSESAI